MRLLTEAHSVVDELWTEALTACAQADLSNALEEQFLRLVLRWCAELFGPPMSLSPGRAGGEIHSPAPGVVLERAGEPRRPAQAPRRYPQSGPGFCAPNSAVNPGARNCAPSAPGRIRAASGQAAGD